MNDRIKSLLDQAKKHVEHGEGCYPATTIRYDALEKFAELIVRECIEVIEKQKAKMSYGPTFVIEDIKNHFGVEE